MSTHITIHRVLDVSVTDIACAGECGDGPYRVTVLKITNEKGEAVRFNLYSDGHSPLAIHDERGE